MAFATRVSERLRHKDRAIALWDYEHLILEAFPEIYQARCLNHTRYEPSATGTGIYRELAPGHVTVVTIPDRTGPDARDPLRPFTSLRVLREIEQFLAERMSCFATLHVRNPQFEEVRVDLRVRFRDGVDETFHVNRLKREITEFLSPWAFRSDARPTFNGKVYKSVLVNFVEERPYVDYVSDVHLFHRLPGVTADGPDLEEVAGSRAISILVSVPSDQHGVHAIHPDEVVVRRALRVRAGGRVMALVPAPGAADCRRRRTSTGCAARASATSSRPAARSGPTTTPTTRASRSSRRSPTRSPSWRTAPASRSRTSSPRRRPAHRPTTRTRTRPSTRRGRSSPSTRRPPRTSGGC